MTNDNMNVMQWDGGRGHYEVWYLTLTDPGSGEGFWIRYTMVAPTAESGGDATCSLWFCSMVPDDPGRNVGRKATFPIAELSASREPFRIDVGDAVLTDYGARGSIDAEGETCAWDLSWQPTLPAYGHVHPALRAAKLAKTVLFLPHADLEITGTIEIDGRTLKLDGVRGGQAHLWGTKHASRWVWAHCNDLAGAESGRRIDTFVDGASVFVHRFGRQIGPATPIVARIGGHDLPSIRPVTVQRNPSEFSLTGWRFEGLGLLHKLRGEVSTRREDLVGVTYHDPDGELAYCYNTEVADMRLEVFERGAPWKPWVKVEELVSDGRAHFEYAQREPVAGVELRVT